MRPLLEVNSLWAALARRRQRTILLRSVDLNVMAGEVHGLVGESGAGKSMLARAVLGILPPDVEIIRGGIALDGQDLIGMTPRARRQLLGADLALIPQDPMTALNPVRRIGSQMVDGLTLHLKLDRKTALARCEELLASVHLRDPARILKQYPFELSGGMRQRVLIAMAFACKPRLIIADEPTTALDVTVQRQILRLIRDLQEQAGTAILFVTHDLGVVARICDQVTVLHTGRVVERAKMLDLFAAPQHDYTRALMRAMPRYDRPADTLIQVPIELAQRLRAEAEAMDHAVA
jgi:peptide/nickel transport system ATP-binding protein